MANTYTLKLQSEFTEAERIPDFIEGISNEENLDEDLKGKVMLALSEAATNAIVHGNKEVYEKTVDIRVKIDNIKVVITVQDEGQGFNPEDTPDPMKEENLLAIGGRGLFLMDEYADNVTYSKGGRLVTMRFNR